MGTLVAIHMSVFWAVQPPPVSRLPAGHCALIVRPNAPLSTLKHCRPSSAVIRASLSLTAAATAVKFWFTSTASAFVPFANVLGMESEEASTPSGTTIRTKGSATLVHPQRSFRAAAAATPIASARKPSGPRIGMEADDCQIIVPQCSSPQPARASLASASAPRPTIHDVCKRIDTILVIDPILLSRSSERATTAAAAERRAPHGHR